MTQFYLLRHGETAWNLEDNRYCGRTDIPLSTAGREQAHIVAGFLRAIPFAAAFCSPLQRSAETAASIAAERDFRVIRDARLAEIDFGEWEGKTRSEIEQAYPDD